MFLYKPDIEYSKPFRIYCFSKNYPLYLLPNFLLTTFLISAVATQLLHYCPAKAENSKFSLPVKLFVLEFRRKISYTRSQNSPENKHFFTKIS